MFTFIVEFLGRRTGEYTWICRLHTVLYAVLLTDLIFFGEIA